LLVLHIRRTRQGLIRHGHLLAGNGEDAALEHTLPAAAE
jgi:hypothetical protein